jgi:hypothetical protein
VAADYGHGHPGVWRASVLLEVGPGGLPHRIFAQQARRVGAALVAAADLAGRVNG